MYITLLRNLPIAVAAAIFVVSAVRLYRRAKGMSRSELIKLFEHTKYIQARVLLVVFVLTAVFGALNYLYSKKFVYAVVSLNYSEASQAQNSNGTRYNMAEIVCDEVLERAIGKGALENVTARDLEKCLDVQSAVQGGVGNASDYHISTEFVISYHASRATQHLDAENVIKLITAAYKEYYIEKYTDNFKLENDEKKPDLSKMEYMDIVLYFNKESTKIVNYLYGMAEKGPDFVTKGNTTFSSIAGKVYQFRETQIEQNLKSLILQHGIVRNREEYVDRLSYQNRDTDFDRRRNAVSFDICNQAIAMYSEEMTRVVLVPTWDETGKYYMGRTKVGIDELSVNATEYSNAVAQNEKSIMDNDLIIGKMQASTADSSSYEAADALVTAIDTAISALENEAIAAGREYSNRKMNQCIAVSISGNSLFSGLHTVFFFAVLAYISMLPGAVAKTDTDEPEEAGREH